MAGKNIFEIHEEYLRIINEIEENDGLVTEELEERLHINKNEMEAKMEAYFFVIKQKEGEIDMIDKEIERLKSKKTSRENLITKLKTYMLQALNTYGDNGKTGNKNFKTPKISIWNVFHKPLKFKEEEKFRVPAYTKYILTDKLNGPELIAVWKTIAELRQLSDPTKEVDLDKLAIPVSVVIDKTTIAKDLKEGKKIEGVEIDTEANHLRMS